MSWQHATTESLTTWVSKYHPNEQAFAPFIELFDRYANHVEFYLIARSDPQDIGELHADVFKRAWFKFKSYRPANSIAEWLLEVADEVISHTRDARPSVGLPSYFAEHQQEFEAILSKLSSQYVELVRYRMQGGTISEYGMKFGLNQDRMQSWIAAIIEQFQKARG